MTIKKIITSIAKITVCGILLCFCLFMTDVKSGNKQMGMFSWKSNVFEDGGTKLFSFMKQHKFTELYQWFSDDLDESLTKQFLNNAKDEGISIYVLDGEPIWANDAAGREQLKVVDKTARISKMVAKNVVKGIVYDIEPYLLDKWESNTAKIMERFISGMKAAYTAAASKNLEVVLCIPFYYDNMDLKAATEKLIQRGCDRVAIMNYFKQKEASNIETEVKYAQRYEKGIINIYEFKPAGEHGLRDVNTYYSDGFEAALSSFNAIEKAFPDSSIIMAGHDYEALKEVLNKNE